ncbi:hypothetical protein [Pseudoalteromonas sp. NZS11_1]|uniref:hypothetical protein n=1 Tax=Pseudoalteromonas sp. NZS11_1 TaxID=2792070 RepID=UPI0018CE0D43|nr:hypothetical protein [Pseudoalteromonas sp. NZS11_1]MBH0045683.1 hypothetical protein [Pseudoalteromonas sp. NZS11_1]
MESISSEDYRSFLIREGLFHINHDILESSITGYAIAANKEQLDIYIEELQKIKKHLK